MKVPGTENPADLCTKGLGGDLIAKFTKSVNGIFSDGRPMMCPTISAVSVPSQNCLGCLLPSVRKMFCYKVHVIQRNGNVKANYFQDFLIYAYFIAEHFPNTRQQAP